jgi:PKD repeat protein
MTETGVCSPVTAVSIYIDPLSPIEDQTVSFNGSAKSDDPITAWEWKFGDGFTATKQAVTHPYGSAGIYTVELKVTNDCGEYATTTRNVTVSEEVPETGTIKCTSNQTGFAVYVDDVYINHSYGNTYLVVPNVEPGSRKVIIEKGVEYQPTQCEVTVTVVEGEITDVDCQMTKIEPTVGSTTLSIQQPIGEDGVDIPWHVDVEIWVDGKDTRCNPPKTLTFGTGVYCDCISPYNLVPCELGQHTITLKADGYDDKSISVYLRKDEPKTWPSPVMVKSVALPPERTINIVVPVGSALYVDGKSITGTTTVGRLSTIFNDLRKR